MLCIACFEDGLKETVPLELPKRKRSHLVMAVALQQFQQPQLHRTFHKVLWGKWHRIHPEPTVTTTSKSLINGLYKRWRMPWKNGVIGRMHIGWHTSLAVALGDFLVACFGDFTAALGDFLVACFGDFTAALGDFPVALPFAFRDFTLPLDSDDSM